MPGHGFAGGSRARDPPDAIELLDKLDRELLTSDDAEQLFRRLEGPRRRPCDALDALGGDDASTRTRDPEAVAASCVPDSPDNPFCYASGFDFNSASCSLINALISSVMESNVVHCSL